MTQKILLSLCALICLALVGCGQEYGKVEQGRTVAYDKDKKVALVILDAGIDDKNPHYTVLPAHEFIMPRGPFGNWGRTQKPGLRIKLDVEKNIITMYNPQTKAFETCPSRSLISNRFPKTTCLCSIRTPTSPVLSPLSTRTNVRLPSIPDASSCSSPFSLLKATSTATPKKTGTLAMKYAFTSKGQAKPCVS